MKNKVNDVARGRVIITYGRSVISLVAVHSLAKKGLEIYACDSLDMTILKFSKYVKKSFVIESINASEEEYILSLEKLIIENKPTEDIPYVLMPVHKETYLISKYKERLSKHIKVAAPDISCIAKVHPKDNFAITAQENAISTPKTLQINSLEDFDAEFLDFPLLLKPIDATGGRGIVRVNNYEELKLSFLELTEHYQQPAVLQEIVSGEDYCFAGIFNQGELVAHMAYTNVYRFPAESGAGCMRKTVDDSKFKSEVEKLAKALNWHGIAEFDFMWDGKETSPAYMIEVNPRFWGGLFQSVESGIDFPWLLYELTVTGSIIEEQEAHMGTKTKIPLIWMIPAFSEFISEEGVFNSIKESFRILLEKNKSMPLLERLKGFGGTLKNSFDSQSIKDLKSNKPYDKLDIKTEVLSIDDPFTSLGVLYILSSLMKEGELPEEVKF